VHPEASRADAGFSHRQRVPRAKPAPDVGDPGIVERPARSLDYEQARVFTAGSGVLCDQVRGKIEIEI
jgi:hypothetical protein